MAEELQRLVCLDSSVLIDYFRKSSKEKSFLLSLSKKGFEGFVASVVVQYEVYKGATENQQSFWNDIFEEILIVPYTEKINLHCISIYKQLRSKRKSIELDDLVIASTSASLHLPLATINKKHFVDITGLELITPETI